MSTGVALGVGARLVAIATGLWLMVAPAVLGTAGELAGKSDRTVGPICAAIAFVAIWSVVRAMRWWVLPFAAYLVVGPWVLGFPTDAAVNDLVCGLVIGATAFVRGEVPARYGGGWSGLRERYPGLDRDPAPRVQPGRQG